MTLKESWRDYLKKCFPEPVPAVQEIEMERAFMAGCFTTLGLIMHKCEVEPDDDICELYIRELHAEAHDFCKLQIEKDKTTTSHN